MIYQLKGTVQKLKIPELALEVNGVSYLITAAYPFWDSLRDGAEATVVIFTFVREDRLDLFGFADANDRSLFAELLNISGVGPRLALELCSFPKEHILQAVHSNDTGILTTIKGVGKKTAEKLLVDLKSLSEKHPEWLADIGPKSRNLNAALDSDAIAALTSLGYDQFTVIESLKKIPTKINKTEDRVKAVLKSL